MKKIFRFIFSREIITSTYLGIFYGCGVSFVLFNPQTPHQTELNLASYGINRYSVVPLITAAALGTTILGKLFSVGFHHFYSLSDESIVRETEKLLNDLDISEKDRETLANGMTLKYGNLLINMTPPFSQIDWTNSLIDLKILRQTNSWLYKSFRKRFVLVRFCILNGERRDSGDC